MGWNHQPDVVVKQMADAFNKPAKPRADYEGPMFLQVWPYLDP